MRYFANPTQNTTFNFAQPHPSTPTTLTSGMLKIGRQLLTIFLKIIFIFANICQVKIEHIENNRDDIT
jgi:hypothetical protein